MNRSLRLTLCLLALACSSKPAPESTPSPSPNIDPGRLQPTGEVVVRYPTKAVLRYELYRRDSTVAQMPSGESQTQAYGRTAYLTFRLAPDDSGAQVSIVLDSIALDADANISMAALDSSAGTQWTGHMDQNGAFGTLTPDRISGVGELVRSNLQGMFVTLPQGGARQGAKWDDTSSRPLRLTSFDATAEVQTHSEAGSVTQVDRRRALPVSSTRASTFAGSGSQFGQEMEVQGSSADTLSSRLGLDGVLLGVEGRGASDFKIVVSAVGQEVPVKQSSQYRLTLLP